MMRAHKIFSADYILSQIGEAFCLSIEDMRVYPLELPESLAAKAH